MLQKQRMEKKKMELETKKKMKSSGFPQLTPLILQSIASYLDVNGFSKTLSALRSEASLEIDGLKVQSLDLEAACGKYLETTDYHVEANMKDLKEQDPCESLNVQHDVEPKKKKRKKNSGGDANMEIDGSLLNGVTDELHAQNKDKKIKSGSKKSKSDADDDVHDKLLELSPVKSEKKKKKSETVFDSLGEDNVEIVPETIKEAANTSELGKFCKKSKDKKNKNKLISDPPANLQQDSPGSSQEVIKKKPKDLKGPELVTETVPVEIPLGDTNKKLKDKKKKKGESLTDTRKEDVLVSEENFVALEKKSSKKRKRHATEELDSRADDDITGKGKDPNKIDGSREKNENELLEDSTKAKEKPSADDSKKEANGFANSHLPKKGIDITLKTTKKEHSNSAEPKTVNAFQRVKVDEVKFVDERLQDNSYWAKSGAESGYGAKAQEVFGQVKGRDFRHEKTKKKRGSYRGGLIDLESHSIKFNYSDDE
eukprot:TRINITY_DN2883_c0_g1_i1.p1 TRINITY_DN2883_c0_g1~~TRINITY_DN2883_c0_g1_i1.p1  ORF type:complete len:484 (-),score=158.10 TRINITY_DN2883_c0_g1_i1:400-1851(-)